MCVPRENAGHAGNAAMRVHKHEPEHFHTGRLCLPSMPIWLVLFMSALILVSCGPTGSGNGTPTEGTPTEGTPTPNPQVHASWQMQLETAQKEVAKIDPTAVIQWVAATFTVTQLRGDKALRTDFIFINPNGVRTDVAVEDTSLPGVAYLVPAVDTWNVKPSQADLQRYASLISKVKIGPRELAQKILDNDVSDIDPMEVSMRLDDDYQKDFGGRQCVATQLCSP
jgi:hypothetical protein